MDGRSVQNPGGTKVSQPLAACRMAVEKRSKDGTGQRCRISVCQIPQLSANESWESCTIREAKAQTGESEQSPGPWASRNTWASGPITVPNRVPPTHYYINICAEKWDE